MWRRLAGGGVPLFVLMSAASVHARPELFLVPVFVVVIVTTLLIGYDEFVFHRKRCGRLETLMHRAARRWGMGWRFWRGRTGVLCGGVAWLSRCDCFARAARMYMTIRVGRWACAATAAGGLRRGRCGCGLRHDAFAGERGAGGLRAVSGCGDFEIPGGERGGDGSDCCGGGDGVVVARGVSDSGFLCGGSADAVSVSVDAGSASAGGAAEF